MCVNEKPSGPPRTWSNVTKLSQTKMCLLCYKVASQTWKGILTDHCLGLCNRTGYVTDWVSGDRVPLMLWSGDHRGAVHYSNGPTYIFLTCHHTGCIISLFPSESAFTFLPIAHWSHLRCSGLVNTDGLYSAGFTNLGRQALSWTVDWRWWRPPACGRFDYMLLPNFHRLQQCRFYNFVLFSQKPHWAPHTLPAAGVRLHLPKLWHSLTL